MFQNLTRAIAQDQELFGWLRTLYPIWGRLTPDAIIVSTQLALAELMLSGCTTTSDHLYLFPNGVSLEHEIEAAQGVGVRFVAARGSMSVGETKGGLPPDWLVEDEDVILHNTRFFIEKYHDPRPHAMMQIAVAPCSPFSVSQALMRASADLARSYGVRLHTHLAETPGDVAYSLEKFGALPGDYAQDVGWVGGDVWHAHCVCLNDREIALFGRTRTGVCHCPSSNLRLASGIAPIRKMREAGVPVGLGVDGSASNDG
ncbi:MAG: amidohydrolase family protein, partial [Blastochloris sp.]|nr:amidohydrolase family protein [Blastochloris sp.]